MHANGFACDDPAIRTVDVLAFCSWSALYGRTLKWNATL
jgi:hypothetical protein